MTVEPLLELTHVARSFGGIRAVADLSLAVRPGEIIALIGPNGAGKTTAFNVITRIFPATTGAVWLRLADGRRADVTRWPTHRIAQAGVARTFQNIRLFAELTALHNVKLGLHGRTRGGLAGALLRFPIAAEERAVEHAAWRYLDFVGLGDHAGAEAGGLPYGDQRRLEIARALASHPRLLLLDEPAAGMHPGEKDGLARLIQKIRAAGITILLIEHDMKLVMGVSDRVYVMDHGELIAHGPPAEVGRDPAVIEAYLGAPA